MTVMERWIDDWCLPGRVPRRIEDRIWTDLPADEPAARYDGRAAFYDRVIGNAIYNRLVWGARTADYRAFAEAAVESGRGPMLDAGCGSAVFTADAYVRHAGRPLVLVDRSLDMLRAAKRRIERLDGGKMPSGIILLQADLFELPFRPGIFETVLSMGMLHLFDDAASLLRRLNALRGPGGRLFATSLVTDRAVGRAYLNLIHRAGEVATPRSMATIRAIATDAIGPSLEVRRRGNMASLTAS